MTFLVELVLHAAVDGCGALHRQFFGNRRLVAWLAVLPLAMLPAGCFYASLQTEAPVAHLVLGSLTAAPFVIKAVAILRPRRRPLFH